VLDSGQVSDITLSLMILFPQQIHFMSCQRGMFRSILVNVLGSHISKFLGGAGVQLSRSWWQVRRFYIRCIWGRFIVISLATLSSLNSWLYHCMFPYCKNNSVVCSDLWNSCATAEACSFLLTVEGDIKRNVHALLGGRYNNMHMFRYLNTSFAISTHFNYITHIN